MTLVVGTAGHIDHGKTALLRALTGIDADRLPEEQRRGMTIDVGYAHGVLDGDREIDFIDVPGHDRLVGNMLVGAGEIDAAMLVVAADDGPRAQTLEHLELLDALGIGSGLAVVTKTDAVDEERVEEVVDRVARLLEATSLGRAPVVAVSSTTRQGIDRLGAVLAGLSASFVARSGPPSLAVDRVFVVRGRGLVVTGTLRGGPVAAADVLRLWPAGREVRVREVQVHGRLVEAASGGRTALNLAGIGAEDVRRGDVLTADPMVVPTDGPLVAIRPRHELRNGRRIDAHLGTARVEARLARGGPIEPLQGGQRVVALKLAAPVAARPGDRFVLRDPGSRSTLAGGFVLDPDPPRGPSRRRVTAERVDQLLATVAGSRAGDAGTSAALLALHGVRRGAIAEDLADELAAVALRAVADHHRSDPDSAGIDHAALRESVAAAARRAATVTPREAKVVAGAVCDALLRRGRLERDGDRVHEPGRRGGPSEALRGAMDRLEAELSVAAPPALPEAAQRAGCPPEGIRLLEASKRIVRLDGDLAYATSMLRRLEELAVELAKREPLTPARLRDETGTSRRYVLAILEELDRRQVLVRTATGHVPGPRAPVAR